MPFKLVIPAACSSAMTGARSAAVRLARADRAMSAVFGGRWPKWRPVGIAPVCQSSVNGSQTPVARPWRRVLIPLALPEQLRQPRDVDRDAPRLVGRWRWCDKERPAGAGLVGVANAPSGA
jgi:hypothetical protein